MSVTIAEVAASDRRPLRIAVGGIHIESSTFTPYRSGDGDFQEVRGPELLRRYPWTDPGNPGFLPGVEWVPLLHARALPGGPVSAEYFARWKQEFFGLLRAAQGVGSGCAQSTPPLDGVLLDIHGAMAVEGILDPEGEIAAEVREVVGAQAVIAATMDLHGNVSDELFAACDMLTCYRTAPHVDAPETRFRAALNLVNYLSNYRDRPLYRAHVPVPILLPGEKTSTQVEPGKSLYARIPELCDGLSVMDVAVWMGFPWADQPRCRGAVVACGLEKDAVAAAARQLATQFWQDAQDFDFVGPTKRMEAAVVDALRAARAPFFISDMGDNPGAGGADDMVVLLRTLLELYRAEGATKRVVFASIFDPDTVSEAAATGAGGEAEFAIGGKLDPRFGGPVCVKAVVKRLFMSPDFGGVSAVLALADFPAIEVIVTAERAQYSRELAFARAGYPGFIGADIVVVKMGYLEPDLARAARGWRMALTPGAVDQDLPRMGHKLLQRPLFPFDPVEECQPGLYPRSHCH